jgi:spore coat assembly protein
MENFRIGDVVARKSYNYDILFKIVNIYNNGIVDLQGLTVRIVADAIYFGDKI